MTKAERLIKDLELDYKTIIEDAAFEIKPKDFLCKLKIVYIKGDENHIMLLWDGKNNKIVKRCEFDQVGNITDVYSYLYRYYLNNLNEKNGTIRISDACGEEAVS